MSRSPAVDRTTGQADAWLTAVERRCQALSEADSNGVGERLSSVRQVFDVIPESLSVYERTLLVCMIGQLAGTLSRLSTSEPIDIPRLVAGVTRWAPSRIRVELLKTLDGLDQQFESPRKSDVPQAVSTALKVIAERHRHPGLSLPHVARAAAVSRWYLCRALKRYTGHNFRNHLHQARVRDADHLLFHSGLSIKEIAALVGYNSTAQLDRHFRRAYRESPTARRMRAVVVREGS
jgi:AraC-like DNA-binding protein